MPTSYESVLELFNIYISKTHFRVAAAIVTYFPCDVKRYKFRQSVISGGHPKYIYIGLTKPGHYRQSL